MRPLLILLHLILLLLLLRLPCFVSIIERIKLTEYDPEECVSGTNSYQGFVNVTVSGNKCLPWIEAPALYKNFWTRDHAKKQANYCRNPDNDGKGPWCPSSQNTYAYCNIKRCAEDVACYEGTGKGYSFSQDRTKSGLVCKPWIDANNLRSVKDTFRFYHRKKNGSVQTIHTRNIKLRQFRSCRNPSGMFNQPSCYIANFETQDVNVEECDIPSCSDSSTLLYPIVSGSCAYGFVEGTTLVHDVGKPTVLKYCSMQHRLIHKNIRPKISNSFKDFCLYLSSETSFCPAGFKKTSRYLPNRSGIRSFGPKSIWRLTQVLLIETILCCSEKSFFENKTQREYIEVQRRKSSIMLPSRSFGFELPRLRQRVLDLEPTDEFDEFVVSETLPHFASVHRCPFVPKMIRTLTSVPVKPGDDNQATSDIVCEYYPEWDSEIKKEHHNVSIAILVKGPNCPSGFEKHGIPKLLLFAFGSDSALCSTPMYVGLQHPTFKQTGYCFLVVIKTNVTDMFVTFSKSRQYRRFVCPKGFHPYEIRFSRRRSELSMCCSNPDFPESTDERTNTKAPLNVNISFAVITNGRMCPAFFYDDKKLSIIQYTTGLSIPNGEEVQIFGEADPIKVEGALTLSVCQYMDAKTTLGVMSTTFSCAGLGQNFATGFIGSTCGFRVNQTVKFPPGRYCFYLLSDSCPEGFIKSRSVIMNGMDGLAGKGICCREEESLGAIRLPIELKAPFKLPREVKPCQAFLNFNVDSEHHYCYYYPQGNDPQALFVWPRVIVIEDGKVVSKPYRCLHGISKSPTLGFIIRRYYTYRFYEYTIFRDRWNSSLHKQFQGCLDEVYWSIMPARSTSTESYCIFVYGSCPSDTFETLGVSPFMNGVLCCSKPSSVMQTYPSNKPTAHIRSMVALGRLSTADEIKLKNFVGQMVLSLNPRGNDSSAYCPQFEDLLLTRRIAQVLKITSKFSLDGNVFLSQLFNASNLSNAQFTSKTGISQKGGKAYIIYCEYKSTRFDILNYDGKTWPSGNYAIPKSLFACPNGSEVVTIHHKQDAQGFHYSQPIHLDGRYMQRYKNVWLSYCVFNQHNTPDQTHVSYDNGLPPGHYCVLRVKGQCPHAFTEGTLSIFEGPIMGEAKQESDVSSEDSTSFLVDTKPPPDIKRVRTHATNNHRIVYRKEYKFCCRTDSPSAETPITGFPAVTGPFYLYRIGDKCQEIEGLRVTDEFICMDAPSQNDASIYSLDRNQTWTSYNTEGMTPVRVPYKDHCDAEIDLCYYEQDAQLPENETFIHNTVTWPVGQYALPNVHRSDLSTACPPGFTQRLLSMARFQMFFDIEVIPVTMGPYFLEWFTHNYTSLSVHYCSRVETESEEDELVDEWFKMSANSQTDANMTDEELADQWPKGDYCVIADSFNVQCPPGLHRYSKVLFELCCRKDEIETEVIVNWAFTGDFFLFGGAKCLAVNNTKTERYLVRIVSEVVDKHDEKWDVLCHYIPKEWLDRPMSWSNEEFMLPIGRRSGIKLSSLATFTSNGDADLATTYMNETNKQLLPQGPGKYSCPESFNRTRFTFVSRESTKQKIISDVDGTESLFQSSVSTAMEFCVKNNTAVNSSENVNGSLWPAGDYCVFTVNKECPINMRAQIEIPYKIPRFFLKRVDVLNEEGESVSAIVHDQNDAMNHVLYFMKCCREDRNLLLRLPPSKDGFYLASSNEHCSSIPGTVLDREKVTTYLTSSTDRVPTIKLSVAELTIYPGMLFSRNGLLDLCYYHPTQGIDYTSVVTGRRFATSMNMSEQDIDEIAKMCGCAENALCLLSNHAECVCKPGYFGDGRHVCAKVTPFTDICANLCDDNAFCAERMEMNIKKGADVSYIKHVCICRGGYAGDGFTCRPECSSRHCQPFSRCVYNTMEASTECQCLEGTIESDERCHLDVYKTLLQEKDLPQFLVHHDHCLSPSTLEALHYADQNAYFYIFVPKDIIKTCEDLRTHVAIRDKAHTNTQLKAANIDSPIILVTENRTEITIYTEGEKIFIDGESAERKPVQFVNGKMYFLSKKLKRTPHVPGMSPLAIFEVLFWVLLCVIGTGLIFYQYAVRNVQRPRYRPRFRRWYCLQFNKPLFVRLGFTKHQDDGILVEGTDDEN